jgi:hypothetical protein
MRDLANGAGRFRVFKATMAATFADPFLFVCRHRRYTAALSTATISAPSAALPAAIPFARLLG